jgi:hypothetical protein
MSAETRDGYGRCKGCGLREGHVDTCEHAKKRGTVSFVVSVTTGRGHDLEKYLREIERAFANDISILAHDYYPDARFGSRVEVTDA